MFFSEDQIEKLRLQVNSKTVQRALDDDYTLSKREIEVLQLICQQKTAKEIGEILFISVKTEEGHKNNLFLKSGAKNVVGLVIYALRNNYIGVNELPILG